MITGLDDAKTSLDRTYDLDTSPTFLHRTPIIATSSPFDVPKEDLNLSPIKRVSHLGELETPNFNFLKEESVNLFNPTPSTPVTDQSELLAHLKEHYEFPKHYRSDLLSAPMSIHRGRPKEILSVNSPSRCELLQALRSNAREQDENLLNDLLCRSANPYSSLIRTEKYGGRNPNFSTHSKKMVNQKINNIDSSFASPSLKEKYKQIATPFASVRPKSRMIQSPKPSYHTRRVAINTVLAPIQPSTCTPAFNRTNPSTPRMNSVQPKIRPPQSTVMTHETPRNMHPTVNNPYVSLIRTEKYGGRRPNESPTLLRNGLSFPLSRLTQSATKHNTPVVQELKRPIKNCTPCPTPGPSSSQNCNPNTLPTPILRLGSTTPLVQPKKRRLSTRKKISFRI